MKSTYFNAFSLFCSLALTVRCDSGAMTQRNGIPADLTWCCGFLFFEGGWGEFGLVVVFDVVVVCLREHCC